MFAPGPPASRPTARPGARVVMTNTDSPGSFHVELSVCMGMLTDGPFARYKRFL